LNTDHLHVSREHLTKIFQYLEALNQHRNPATCLIADQPWHFWLKDLPDHSSVTLNNFSVQEDNLLIESTSTEKKFDDDFVLKVKRPKLTDPPKPPEILQDWLERGWDNPDRIVKVHESINRTDSKGNTITEKFTDDLERKGTYDNWLSVWNQWAIGERPARASMRVFEKIYELYSRLQKESEKFEMVLGDGVLKWRNDLVSVNHPILLQRLQLEFNPDVPEFIFRETNHEVELYSALFRSMENIDGTLIAKCREELLKQSFHPLGTEDTSGYFRRVVVQLSSRGKFIDDGVPEREEHFPQIGRCPVIFMRSRTLGLATVLENILEDINQREVFAPSLLKIAGVYQDEPQINDAIQTKPWEEPKDILFGKNANPEQIQIARSLNIHNDVLVQGPPGTGKTHTIANLIGHLLTQGKSVLITSHTTKALSVLRGQVVEELRSLCVSVLDSDIASRRQLEESINDIVTRLTSSDVNKLVREATALEKSRENMIEKLNNAKLELLNSINDEYLELIYAGRSYTPSEAARIIADGIGIHDWIPAPVSLGEPLPLTQGELLDLYATNRTITLEDESELLEALPEPQNLMNPNDFESQVEQYHRLSAIDFIPYLKYWDNYENVSEPDVYRRLLNNILNALSLVSENGWESHVIFAGWKGCNNQLPWENLAKLINQVKEESEQLQETLIRYQPKISAEPLESQSKVVEEILHQIANGGNIGLIILLVHPTWKKFIDNSSVRNKKPNSKEDFQALKLLIGLEILRRELKDRWDYQLSPLGVDTSAIFGKDFESVAFQYEMKIQNLLRWREEVWLPIEEELQIIGFRWEDFLQEQPPCYHRLGELLRLKYAITGSLENLLINQENRARLALIMQQFKTTKEVLINTGRKSSRVIETLLSAINTLNVKEYTEGYLRLIELQQKQKDLNRRRELLKTLDKAAPAWANAIRKRRNIHAGYEVPGDARDAWRWRQLNDQLEFRGKISLHEIQQRIEGLNQALRRETNRLIEVKAWSNQMTKTSTKAQQALVGYLDLIKKIGRGTGKRVPRLQQEAKRKMVECRNVVPVWIMPINQVAENFEPNDTQFDVVIIDEASQCDVMGLISFYMAQKVVVVGDNEQVSPVAVGQKLEVVQRLIDEHLQGIPNNQLYDGQMSIYDLARQSFGGAICLLEHFRCVPDIIQFSNKLSYNWRIKPLRDTNNLKLTPPIVSYRVKNGWSDSKLNPKEAGTLASLLVAAIEQSEYSGKTFGVISLLGDEQATEIERLLREHLTEGEYIKRKIICGNSAHFQGDERDVIFLSMVDSSNGYPPLSLRSYGANDMYKKRYNVAVSRAKDQLWVIHSLDCKVDLKPGDLRRELLEYAENPKDILQTLERVGSKAESVFEKEVIKRLISLGYNVIPQWKVGFYRIDLVIQSGDKKLAIECDGDRYHPMEKIYEDMERQAILERLGWKFVRIRGSHFFRNPDEAIEPVLQRIKDLGIVPENSGEIGATLEEYGLKERVIRRAAELLREWYDEVNDGEGEPQAEQGVKFDFQQIKRDVQTLRISEEIDKEVIDKEARSILNRDTIQESLDFRLDKFILNQNEISIESPTIQQSIFDSIETDDVAIDLCKTKRLEFIDKRQQGGTLWIIGGEELTSIISEFQNLGYRFKYMKAGIATTSRRPAWYLV
jgi:very-short-patch-repair endonuclease/DNA polymerase III delta prime subunit